MTRPRPFEPTRRAFLGASAGALLAPSPARAAASTVVDVHCHVFNASDLPITGFVAHFIPGLSDLSDNVWGGPEWVVRKVVGLVHDKIINKVAPGLPDELRYIASLSASSRAQPVVFPANATEATNYQAALKAIMDELAVIPLLNLGTASVRATVDRAIRIIYLIAHERARIAATMTALYPSVQLFTPLLVDYDAWSNDKPATPLLDQVDAHGAVARASTQGLIGRADARFHPFVAFDPLREVRTKMKTGPYRPYGDGRVFPGAKYACPPVGSTFARPASAATAGGIEIVRYAIESAGCIGCKVYPPVGFAPLDNEHLNADNERLGADTAKKLDLALRAFYSYCEAEQVPITTHASTGNEYGLGFRDLVMPSRWGPVLSEFPNLRLNLGHFGHDYGVDPKAGVAACTAWIRQAAALMSAYPNVYADFSGTAAVYDDDYATRYLGDLDQIFARFPSIKRRVMYGTDYWLSCFWPNADQFYTRFVAKWDAKFSSIHADIMGQNALRFLGFLDDEGKKPAGSRSAARLRRFYGAVAPPAWL